MTQGGPSRTPPHPELTADGRFVRAAVVSAVNYPRTQNGHIRNDTRDVSRRMLPGPDMLISRRNCAEDDRACTRVTRRNLHGKEGVDGSSPSEGSAKSPLRGVFLSARLADRPGCGGYGAFYGAFRSRTPLGPPPWVRHLQPQGTMGRVARRPKSPPLKVELWSDASLGNGPAALVTPWLRVSKRGSLRLRLCSTRV